MIPKEVLLIAIAALLLFAVRWYVAKRKDEEMVQNIRKVCRPDGVIKTTKE